MFDKQTLKLYGLMGAMGAIAGVTAIVIARFVIVPWMGW